MKNNKCICKACNKEMIPRMVFENKKPAHSLCPFCGAEYKNFKEEKWEELRQLFASNKEAFKKAQKEYISELSITYVWLPVGITLILFGIIFQNFVALIAPVITYLYARYSFVKKKAENIPNVIDFMIEKEWGGNKKGGGRNVFLNGGSEYRNPLDPSNLNGDAIAVRESIGLKY